MMEPKFLEVYKITFSKNMHGELIKNYEGLLRPQDFGDVETGISVVIQHIYLHKIAPKGMFGMKYCPDNLFEIIISKNAAGEFRIDSAASEVTPNDLENIITGLVELLIKLHLKRMEVIGEKFTLAREPPNF